MLENIKIPGMVLIDGEPIARDVSIRHDFNKRLGRYKWEYLPHPDGTGACPVDINFHWPPNSCSVNLTSGANITVYGSDLLSKREFYLAITMSFITKVVTAKGNVGRDIINLRIKINPFEALPIILEALRPVLTGQN